MNRITHMLKIAGGRLAGLTVLGALLALVGTPIQAQNVDFSGKRISVIVSFREGGGTDLYARYMAHHMSRHLPGNPVVLVRNIPGAGGVPGANEFQRDAKPDGLTVLVLSSSHLTNSAMETKTVRYKLATYQPIILSPLGSITYGAPSLGVRSPADLRKLVGQEVVYGGNSPTSIDLRQLFMFDALGLTVKAVWGMNGSKARLAFRRGEINIMHAPAPVYLKKIVPLEAKGQAVSLWSAGVRDDNGNYVRDPNAPNVPTFTEVYRQFRGKDLTGAALEAWDTIFDFSVTASKAWVLPAATPKEIVETYRNAARAMLKDPEFQRTRADVIGVYDQVIGERGRKIIKTAATFSPDAKAYIRKMLREKYGINR